jgi:hypothetical protein
MNSPATALSGHCVRERARAYIAKLPPSIQGSRGSDALFAAATALVRGFSLPPEEAFPLLAEWNAAHAVPPWSVRELQYKLKSAAAASRRPAGWLLQTEPRRTARLRMRRSPPPAPASAIPGPSVSAAAPDAAAAEKAERRCAWPRFSSLIRDDLEQIAALRKLPLDAVYDTWLCGFLTSAVVDGHRSFILREDNFAQARRFDGLPFVQSDGRTVKAKNLSGSEGHFIGLHWLGPRRHPVLIVEGAVALMEGHAAAEAAQAASGPSGWAVLAATSAYSRIDDALLADLAGRHVRIVPDADKAGHRAVANWTAALRAAGAVVDAFALPPGIKDLGPLVANPFTHRETLRRIFTL